MIKKLYPKDNSTFVNNVNSSKRYDLGEPIKITPSVMRSALTAQYFVMDGEDLGLYCEYNINGSERLLPDYWPMFLTQYGKFICLSASPDRFLREFLRRYPKALDWADKVEMLRSTHVDNFDPTDPTLFRVDKGVANYFRAILDADSTYIGLLLNSDDAFHKAFRRVYEKNGGKRSEVWSEIALSDDYRADFINFMLFKPFAGKRYEHCGADDSVFTAFLEELRNTIINPNDQQLEM